MAPLPKPSTDDHLLDKYLNIFKLQKFPQCEGNNFFIPLFGLFALMVNHFTVDHVFTIIKDFAHTQTFNENLYFGHFRNFNRLV